VASFKPRCKARITLLLDGRGTPKPHGPYSVDVQPRNASVARNGYHEADTWNLEFDARLVPFDPDQLKQAEVRIYMWDSRGDEAGFWAIDRNEMIRGLADDDEGVLVGEDNSIKMTGRDYTGVLLDAIWDPKQKVPSGKPLDVVLQDLADGAAPKGTRANFVVVNKSSREMPIVGGAVGKKRSTRKKGEWVKPGKSYWDIIYDIAISCGFVAYVDVQSVDGEPLRPVIVLTDPATQTKETLRQAPRLAYGKHLQSLKVKRKLGREKTPQQVLVAWDPLKKQEIQVVYPEVRNQIVTVFDTAIAVDKDEQEFVPAPRGVFDRDLLLEYAKLRFYYRGRAETTYSMETLFLSVTREEEQAIGVDAQGDYDLLRMKPGSAIGVKFDPFNREHLRRLSVGERVQHIRSLGYTDKIAAIVATNLDTLSAFEQPYYFNKGQFDFDTEDGLKIQIDGVNFANALGQEQAADQSDQTAGIL